ncbi:precorrin-4 C(11)-methyltransferase [Desulfobacterales bacterium HSG17]|nr:precorrin-4 C(11)-methyltransferase [Desulfobacterales bacterium HSG17]
MNLSPIVFAGAGPGDPELVTVKTANHLKNSDLVLYTGSLVPEAVLCYCPAHTQKTSSASLSLPEILNLMVSAYFKGSKVVRLHTGDPSLYGAILEQMQILDEKEIPYSVIPGVTAAFAAAAGLQMEFTIPEKTQTLILTRMAGRTPVPEQERMEKLAAIGASMAIYLSAGLVEQLLPILIEHYGSNSLAAVVFKAGHPEEKQLIAPLGELGDAMMNAKITRQAVILVGPGVNTKFQKEKFAESKLYAPEFSHGYRTGD